MRIVVTGGSGKLGLECVRQLVAAGHEVISLDQTLPRENLCRSMRVDFRDYGQVLECFTHIDGGWEKPDAVLHLAAIPGPSNAANAALFHNNTTVSFNVFWAAKAAGIKNVVWASSETLTGVPFDQPPPYLPMDEETPRRPETAYALSKLLDEVMAEEFCRWDPELKMIGLRFSYVKTRAEQKEFAALHDDARKQYWNFWSYIDAEDGAAAAVLAVERKTKGLELYLIASPDTVMERPTADLLAEVFPKVAVRGDIAGNMSLLSTRKAQRVLGWKPKNSWREA
ncbi:MAG: NAD(P)-dependent oxidoreductase [Alphaproteobacteria bacterium]|nr:NAD(P)-dependent oxidoreductase [Alphaproteobacteria bacterium]